MDNDRATFSAQIRTVTGYGFNIQTFSEQLFLDWMMDTLKALTSLPQADNPAWQPLATITLWGPTQTTTYAFHNVQDAATFYGRLHDLAHLTVTESERVRYDPTE